MAKRGRRSIRNKRKSVKKYSSKRRSKTMRYLRGGVLSDDDDMNDPAIIAGLRRAAANYNKAAANYKSASLVTIDDCYKDCSSHTNDPEYFNCRKNCNKLYQTPKGIYEGGRRRYHRRKQSKTRKH